MSDLLDFIQYLGESDKNPKYFAQGSAIGFMLFLLYLELNPKMTNVWFRVEADGKRRFNFDSLVNYLTHPFRSHVLWKPQNLDLNFIAVSGIIGTIYTLVCQGLDFARQKIE